MRSLRILFAIGVVAIALPRAAMAQEVLAGLDFWETVPPPTYQDFMGPFTISGGFFGPNSDPFTGHVPLRGIPLGSSPFCPGANLGSTDTVVRRLQPTVNLGSSGQDVVPIELVALNLVSINPITVTYNGGQTPESWNVHVGVSTVQPSPGQMHIVKTHPNGGTFDSQFRVYPVFTFTRVSDSAVRVLDGGQPPVLFNDLNAFSVPWSYDSGPLYCELPGCTTNFFPGVETPSYTIQPWIQQGPYASQGLSPSCGHGPVAAESRTWGAVKTLYR